MPKQPDTDTTRRAHQLREAALFLMERRDYSLAQLNELIDPANQHGQQLHKNSLLRIKDLRPVYQVRKKQPENKRRPGVVTYRWVTAKQPKKEVLGDDGKEGRWNWKWNPQLSTLVLLEKLLAVAIKEGFDAELEPPTRLTRPRRLHNNSRPRRQATHSKAA